LNLSKTTDYAGNIIYENGSLKRILIDGGYIEGGVYYFYLTDHLGNNRVVANSSGAVIQKTHYYPFGMAFAESSDQGKQPYKYNGKEFDQMHGLNLYDYSARYMEPALGRYTTVDPLAEKYYSVSPYVYCGNNPVLFIDPDGRDLKKARVHLANAVSITFSLGFQVGFKFEINNKGISGKINMASMEVGGFERGMNTLNIANPSISKESSFQYGLLGGSVKVEAKDKENGKAERTKTISANAAFVTVENIETTNYVENKNATYTDTDRKIQAGVKTTESSGIVTTSG